MRNNGVSPSVAVQLVDFLGYSDAGDLHHIAAEDLKLLTLKPIETRRLLELIHTFAATSVSQTATVQPPSARRQAAQQARCQPQHVRPVIARCLQCSWYLLIRLVMHEQGAICVGIEPVPTDKHKFCSPRCSPDTCGHHANPMGDKALAEFAHEPFF